MSQRFLSVFVGIFFCMFLSAQVTDSFSSSTLSSNWEGERSKFTIKEQRLCLSAKEAGTAYLSSYSPASYNGSWEVNIRMDFNPTGSNNARFYLMSDSPSLDGPLNGYYLQIGNSSKQIVLYSVKGTTTKILEKGIVGRLDVPKVDLTIKAVRGNDLKWKIYTKLNDEKSFNEEFSVMDSTFVKSSFTGLYCKFSKTYVEKTSFDNFSVKGDGKKDTEVPKVSSFLGTDSLVTLRFSEWVNPEELSVVVTPSRSFETSWDEGHTQLYLRWKEDLQKGVRYTVDVANLSDYVGNTGSDTSFCCAKKETIECGDLLFTEVMFNPYADGSEFVEIYNVSEKVLDLSELKLSTRKSADSSLYSPKKISDAPVLVFPGEFKVLTSDISGITPFYICKPETFVTLSSFPSLRNETGAVVLFRSSDTLIVDNFYYEASMHEESVPNKGKGVSLTRSSLGQEDWVSSSAVDGYATPGYSTSSLSKLATTNISLQADEVCYPYYDEDGMFRLKYRMDLPNYQAVVNVYSMDDRCVKTLVNNLTLAKEGEISWDGYDDRGSLLRVAPYVVRLDAFHAVSGNRIRRSFVVLLSR